MDSGPSRPSHAAHGHRLAGHAAVRCSVGTAISLDPRHLPTSGLLSVDHSWASGQLVAALRNTLYYDIKPLAGSEAEAERALADGTVLFVINIRPDFDRSVDRGEKPTILMDADATDPSTIGNAAAALAALTTALDRDLPPEIRSRPANLPFQFAVHARYNPEQLTVLNIAPGLILVVLTMSTLFVTTLSITRERERGTMENLLAMPVRPIEVMLAKVVPYIVIGYVQVTLIVVIAALVFGMPIRGSIPLLALALGLFIASNLALGITFSTVARNQMQVTDRCRSVPCCRRRFFLHQAWHVSSSKGTPGLSAGRSAVSGGFRMTHALRIARGRAC